MPKNPVPKNGSPRPATLDELRSKRVTRTVDVVLDDEAAGAMERAVAALKAERSRGTVSEERVAELVAEADRARADLVAGSVSITFGSIGSKALKALMDSHPPTDEQVAGAAEDAARQAEAAGVDPPESVLPPAFNIETLPIALVAACAIDPVMSEDDVADLAAGWNDAEFVPLWTAAMDANSRSRVGQLGKLYG